MGGGNLWTLMGLSAHGLNSEDWLGGLVSESEMGAMLVYAHAGIGV